VENEAGRHERDLPRALDDLAAPIDGIGISSGSSRHAFSVESHTAEGY
jgi:hypothetical protein